MITDRQVRLLRQKRMESKTQETAAAKAGMSVRSARAWQNGPLPSQAKPEEHRWRTRPDPFDGVWAEEVEPLLRNDPTGELKATTIIDWLAKQHPGRFSASQLRTLQRRLQDLRALHGPEREVYFPQEHLTGVCIWCFPLRDDRFPRVRRRARMWVRKQQYPCQPVCLAPKRCRKAICLPSPQIYTYPCQPRSIRRVARPSSTSPTAIPWR